MDIINPITVTNAMLTSSTISETVPLWLTATPYVVGDIRRLDTTHRTYECLVNNTSVSPDTSIAPVATPKWLDLGATNKYACIDEKFGTQSTTTSSMTIVLTPGLVFNSIALLNLLGASVTVSISVPGVGVTYTNTTSLYSDVGVADWYGYFFAPIAAPADVALTGIPPYATQIVTITITGSGTVAIGNIFLGSYQILGKTMYNPTVGIIDYSTKTTDVFGNATVVRRAYAKRLTAKFEIDAELADNVAGILATVRSTPLIWIGTSTFGSTIVAGFYKDWEIEIDQPSLAICTITIEGVI